MGHAPTASFTTDNISTAMKRHCCYCYTVNCHQHRGDQLILAGSHSTKNGCLRLLKLHNGQLEGFAMFDNVSQCHKVVRSSCYIPQSDTLITGGESGIIHVWKQQAVPESPHKFKEKKKKRKADKPY